jgi:hypothetical protein
MIALPPYKTNFVSRVGIYVPGQVTDYYAHRSGLVGSAYDNTWHPDNIKNTIFNYTLYMSIQAARRARDRIAKRLREAQAKLRRLLKRS